MKEVYCNKKVVYFGIDALEDCLKTLCKRGYSVVSIFTMEDDEYDKTERIQIYANSNQIPLQLEPVTSEMVFDFEQDGVEMFLVAGYPWKIPVSDKIRQINIHPAYLPVGRGSWPMPTAILRGVNSGVTLHKLSEKFDEGDILLQEEILVTEQDNLETLTDKIKVLSVKLLNQYLDNPKEIWNKAAAQTQGEYWEEAQDEERTFSGEDDTVFVERILRAFYGYGSLCNYKGIPIEIIRGEVISDQGALEETGSITDDHLVIPISDGYVICREWRLAFRSIGLKDKEKVENIRRKYQPELSDYTFALLYCWQEEMNLTIYLEEDFYVIRSADSFFFPIGSKERTRRFIDGLLDLGVHLKFQFCDEKMLQFLTENYTGKFQYKLIDGDCDYEVSNQTINELKGSAFAKRRNAYSHYKNGNQAPHVEVISEENMHLVKQVSEIFSGVDSVSEKKAIDDFKALDMIGIIVKEGEIPVGFSLCSLKDERTMQGHFMKCISRERGSKFFVMKSCIDAFSDRFVYTNMEDDMGQEGLRKYKSSFAPRLILSYTIEFTEEESV